jgi:RNA polymerase sigma-70 factor (ECF subfamily)
VDPLKLQAASDVESPAHDVHRLKELFAVDLGFVERLLRSFGVPEREVDDAAQEVFIVLSRKLAAVLPGLERGFMFRTAVHIAAHVRRKGARRRESLGIVPDYALDQPSPEELLDERRSGRVLARGLARLDSAALEVFVRHELQNQTQQQIATALALPPGTVASRLRRARRHLRTEFKRLGLRI